MKHLLLPVLCAGVLFVGCSKVETVGTTTPDEGTLIDVVLNGEADATTTKVSYTADADNSQFVFSWNMGDEVSICVPNTTGNDNQKFIADKAEATSTLSGQLATWDSPNTLYAIYPYNALGYEISNGTISYSMENQNIDVSSSNVFDNGLMVSLASNATASSADNYSVSALSFKQVMAFYQLTLTDISDTESITEVGFTSTSDAFVTSATIDLSSATYTSTASSSSISATISGAEGTSATINFALLPVDLSDSAVTLYIKTVGGGVIKSYTKSFDSGVNFERNCFVYNSNGALSLSSDFAVELTDEVSLSEITAGNYPSGDTWVITDASATTVDFEGLKAALSTIYSYDSSRGISLEFPNISSIPSEALYEKINVVSVSAPVATFIGESAFRSSTSSSSRSRLTSINFPMAATVSNYAFYYCSNLTTISLPEATYIGSNAFYYCSNLTAISLPEALSIDVSAFHHCSNVTTISLPKATSIGAYAFYYCSNLTTTSLPEVISIGENAFRNCSNLTIISLPKAMSIGSSAFGSCSNLITISLPEATSIGSFAFVSCSNLTTISLPLATTIDSNAFQDCTNLISASAPTATTINGSSFTGCSSLESVTLSKATTIGNNSFYNCSKLLTLSLPEATSIGSSAFYGCISLTTASIPKTTTLSNSAFYACDALKTLEWATDSEAILKSVGTDIFRINSSETNEGNITLTIGTQNSSCVNGSTLTYSNVSYIFNKIIVSGGESSSITASSENASTKAW
ncbi:MAG: leucine-rich repeat protein [Rikenellaceae bacterium]